MNGKLLACLCAVMWATHAAGTEITYEYHEIVQYWVVFDAWEEAGPKSRVHLRGEEDFLGKRFFGDWFPLGSRFLGYEVAMERDAKGINPIVWLRKPGSRDLRLPRDRKSLMKVPLGTFRLHEGAGTEGEGYEGDVISLATQRLIIRRLTPNEATVQLEGAPEPMKLPISPAAPARAEFRWRISELRMEHERAEQNRWGMEAVYDMKTLLLEVGVGLLCGYFVCYSFIAAGLLTLEKKEDVPRRRRIRASVRRSAQP